MQEEERFIRLQRKRYLPAVPVKTVFRHSRLLLVASLTLSLFLGFLAQWLLAQERDVGAGLAVWGASIAVFAIALTMSGAQAAERTLDDEEPIPFRREMFFLAGVLLLGIFFRLYELDSVPAGLNHDAAWYGSYAIKINDGAEYTPFINCCGSFGRETMFPYLIAGLQTLVGPEKIVIPLAATIVGITTLLAFYLLSREMFGVWVALTATAFLGVMGWHWTFSRIGWRAVLVPLFEVLVFLLLLLALRATGRKRIALFIAAGIALGLSLDTYEAARTIPLSVAAFLGYLALTNRNFIIDNRRELLVYGGAAALALAPLAFHVLTHWDLYWGRGGAVWVGAQVRQSGSLEPLLHNIFDGFLIFNYRGHGDDFYTDDPLLDVPIAIFFVLGFAYSASRIKQPMHILLAIMLTFSLLNGFLSEPNGNRAIGAIVPVAIYVALFLVRVLSWLRDPPWVRPYLPAALLLVLAVTAYHTFDSYMGPNRRTQPGLYPEATQVGLYMRDIAGDYEIHIAAGNWPRETLTYLSYHGQKDPFERPYTYTNDAGDLVSVAPTDRPLAFIVESNDVGRRVFDVLKQRFPTGRTENVFFNDKGTQKMVASVLLIPTNAVPVQVELPRELGFDEEDAERRRDLGRLAAALAEYFSRTGSYPATNNNVQTACVYKEQDRLCMFQPELPADVFEDPRRDTSKYGYWYQSDGKSFTLYATLQGAVREGETCVAEDRRLQQLPNLLCVKSP